MYNPENVFLQWMYTLLQGYLWEKVFLVDIDEE